MKVLFIGDVVGGPGRRGLAAAMPGLRERFAPEIVIVNGENSAGGMGITEKTDTVVEIGGRRCGVINLSGAIGLRVARSPFHEADNILEKIEADFVIVDFHAEVTSEKVAMGWHLDGQVAGVLGVKPELILESLITQMPVKFETADEDVWVMGAVVDVNDKGLADSITPVMVPAPEL